MTLVNGLRRALSSGFLLVDAEGDVPHDWLLDGQPSGDLRNFLLAQHDAVSGGGTVEDAFRDAGGTILLRTLRVGKTRAEGITFVTDDQGRVALRILGGGKGTDLVIRIAIPHSASA